MKTIVKRGLSALLVLVMLVSVLSGIAILASAASYTYNTGTRHEVCTSLSSQAQSYYTGSYTYDALSALAGGTASSDANATNQSAMSSALFQQMQTLMANTHTKTVSYSSLTSYWPYTDASGGTSGTILFYSDTESASFNREHVWPKSHGSFLESYAGCDLHHLRPTNSGVNSTRGNMTMGNVRNVISGYETCLYNGKDVLYYSASDYLVEVNDNIKGDVARILLYVWCRWGEPNLFVNDASLGVGPGDTANDGQKVIESLDTLLQWCQMDPVDTWEMSRNDQTQNVQGNRNIFIDYPELAWQVLGQEVPTDMQTPSGEAMNSAGVSYTITAISNNTAYGTVSVSGSTITAAPADGYYASGYELISGSATVTQDGNTFIAKAASDCTVKIIFSAKTTVTVSFSVPAGVSQSAISGYAGEAITLPTPTGTPSDEKNTYTFLGWVTASVTDTTVKPDILASGASFTPTADTTLYALYSYAVAEEGGSTTAYPLFNGSAIEDGTYIIVDDNTGYAMSSAVDSNWVRRSTTSYASTVETIEDPVESIIWNIAGGVISTADSAINGNTALYSSGAKSIAYDTNGTVWTFTVSNGIWTIASGNNILSLNGNNGWRPYNGGYGNNHTFRLYKAGIGSTSYYTTMPNTCSHNWVAGEEFAPTCTEQGYTVMQCSLCGATEKTDFVAPLGHICGAWTSCNDGTHCGVCNRCAIDLMESCTFVPSIDGATTIYICSVCGAVKNTEPTLDSAISIGQQLFLESDLSLTFRIKQSQLTAYDVSTAYLVVERDVYPTGGEVYVKTDTFTEYTIENSRLVFVYSGIAAAQMNDEIRVTLHIKDSSGKEYVSNTLTTSVTAYAKLLLDAYGTTQASLCTVLMDMLNYGTAAQLYFGRHADAPANTAYAEFANYTSYASADFVTPLENLSSVITNEGATATMNLSVDLSTRVGIIYKVTLPNGVNAANATVVVKDADGNELETLNLADGTVDSKGRYVVTYFGTPSRLMRRVVYGTVYVGGVAISNTYGYSISTYAYQIANTAGMPEALVNLTNLMTIYGDAANTYFGG